METYKSNSEKARKEQAQGAEKKIEKAILGEAVVKRKRELPPIVKTFLAEDVENVKNYILMDVLVPAAKRTVLDIVDGIFNGSKSKGRNIPGSKVSYINYYDRENRERDRRDAPPRDRLSPPTCLDNVILSTYDDADQALNGMYEALNQYGIVSVADFCDIVGVSGNHTDNNYGWTNINSGEVKRVSGGYIVKLPRPFPINV